MLLLDSIVLEKDCVDIDCVDMYAVQSSLFKSNSSELHEMVSFLKNISSVKGEACILGIILLHILKKVYQNEF